jgi:hypothetical protein
MTADTLEEMFIYLGCANIPTQEAMDGAIPLESMMSGSRTGGFIACFKPDEIAKMTPDWSVKTVWFSGDNLGLGTVENVHWSRVSKEMSGHRGTLRAAGDIVPMTSLTDYCDGFVHLYYSEIDRFGRFVKFPIHKKRLGPVVVSKIFNPRWLLEFSRERMECMVSESDQLYKEKRLSFLAPFMCGVAQSLGCYWRVKTKFDDLCPTLTLLTDPTGVKEFWKLRDAAPGKARRAALLHWVEQHWRQTRNDPDVEAFVRAHMRGATEVKKGKLSAVITPSERDTLAEEKAKEERELLRKLKADRRKRKVRAMAGRRA